MSRGINKFIGVGNLGNDPEISYTKAGKAVARLSIAVSEHWKDKDGNKQERAEWIRIVMFDRLAEIAGEYLKKGSQVYIEGKLRTNKWQAQDGSDRYTTEILANELQMLGSANGSRSEGSQAASSGQGGGQHSQPAPNFEDFDDSVPF